MGALAISNRKRFLILIFVFFTILYWALFFPLLWIHTKPRLSRSQWIFLIILAVILYVLLALIAAYLVRKYNWWNGVGSSSSSSNGPGQNNPIDYGFQAAMHRCPSEQNLYFCPVSDQRHERQDPQLAVRPQRKIFSYGQESVEMTTVTSSTPRTRVPAKPSVEVCEVYVDKRVMQDRETQTEDGSISPGLYRTSLIMDVQPRTPRTPSSSDSNRNSWFYPTLADYYKDKTLKLKVRLDKSQQRQLELEQEEQDVVGSHDYQQTATDRQLNYSQVEYSAVSDTKTFLKREQVYNNLEIR